MLSVDACPEQSIYSFVISIFLHSRPGRFIVCECMIALSCRSDRLADVYMIVIICKSKEHHIKYMGNT